MIDSYCIPRDMSSYFSATNYLATAPIVALDARGTGAHTALVMQFDVIAFAFDPNSLAQGPLYVVDPLPDSSKEAASYSTDYLALTAGGSLVGQGWDDTKNDFTVFAVPGILKFAPTNGGAAPSSAGKSAAVAIGSIFGVGAVLAAWVWYVGGVAVAGGILAGLPGVSHVIGLVKGGGSGYRMAGASAASAPKFSASSSSYGATSSPTAASYGNI